MDFQAMKMALICHILGMVHLPYLQTMVLFMDHQEMTIIMNTKNIQAMVHLHLQDPQDPLDPLDSLDPQVLQEDVSLLQWTIKIYPQIILSNGMMTVFISTMILNLQNGRYIFNFPK